MRKIVIIMICIFTACFAYHTIVHGFKIGEKLVISSYSQISQQSKNIDNLILQLKNIKEVQFEEKQNSLSSTVKQYNETKKEYDYLLESANTDEQYSQDFSLVDTYDVDFLWTTIGNYSTEEGISLKFNVIKNLESPIESNAYTMCDLKFTVSGDYIPITDFIYDIEDDNKLGFEISDFNIVKGGENLQATFTVKNVPINNKNLSEISNVNVTNIMVDEYGNPVNENLNTKQ